jgi:hypothetical protein
VVGSPDDGDCMEARHEDHCASAAGCSNCNRRSPAHRPMSFVTFTGSANAVIAGIRSRITGCARSTQYSARSASAARGSFRALASPRGTLSCRSPRWYHSFVNARHLNCSYSRPSCAPACRTDVQPAYYASSYRSAPNSTMSRSEIVRFVLASGLTASRPPSTKRLPPAHGPIANPLSLFAITASKIVTSGNNQCEATTPNW